MKNKIDISFYHFTVTPLFLGISKLIKKIYDTKRNLLVLCKNESEMGELDKTLWTFASREFIPHATVHESNPELQPILLATDFQSYNDPQILLSFRDEVEEIIPNIQKYLYVFYGNSNEVANMVKSYKSYKSREDVETIFWQQDRSGKWIKA